MSQHYRFKPGDIVSEWIGNLETARYIIVDKRIIEDYKGKAHITYDALIIYVLEEWGYGYKPGDMWKIDGEQLDYENFGTIEWVVKFQSGLSW